MHFFNNDVLLGVVNLLLVLREPTRCRHPFQHQPKGQHYGVQLGAAQLYQTHLLQVMFTIFCFAYLTGEQVLYLSSLSSLFSSRATVAQQRTVYWINVKSDALLRGGCSRAATQKWTRWQNIPDKLWNFSPEKAGLSLTTGASAGMAEKKPLLVLLVCFLMSNMLVWIWRNKKHFLWAVAVDLLHVTRSAVCLLKSENNKVSL